MNIKTALKILQEYYQENSKNYGMIQVGLFGSIVRDDHNDESDIDVVVKLEQPDLLKLVAIQQDLSEKFHSKVDVVRYREKMNNFLKTKIENEAIYV